MLQYAVNINVKYGVGVLDQLGELAKPYGKRACVVMDPFFRGGEYETRVKDLLTAQDIDSVFYSDFRSDPDCTDVDKCVAFVQAEGCDFIIAFGGGSCIDMSKATAVVAKNGGCCWDYCGARRENGVIEPLRRPEKGKVPLVAIPTTSGTGSEANCGAVISNRELEIKTGIGAPCIFPELSLVDPALTVNLPPKQTAFTGFDAFSHAFESYMLDTTSSFSEALALQSIRYFGKSYIKTVKDGSDLEARTDMAMCSSLAGINLALTDTSVGHILGQPLSAYFHMPHGATLAVTLDTIVDWIFPNGEEKLANVAVAIDPSLSQLPRREQAASLSGLLRKLKKEAGIDQTLSHYGVTEADFPRILDYVERNLGMDCPLFKQYARVATREDLEQILRASL